MPQTGRGSLSPLAGLCLWVGCGNEIGNNLEVQGPQLISWWSCRGILVAAADGACVFSPPLRLGPRALLENLRLVAAWQQARLSPQPEGQGPFCDISPPVECQLNNRLYPGSVPNRKVTQAPFAPFPQ